MDGRAHPHTGQVAERGGGRACSGTVSLPLINGYHKQILFFNEYLMDTQNGKQKVNL